MEVLGWDGLGAYKANLSPAKLKLADIRLELSLAITDSLLCLKGILYRLSTMTEADQGVLKSSL